jgi:hypothetical protein
MTALADSPTLPHLDDDYFSPFRIVSPPPSPSPPPTTLRSSSPSPSARQCYRRRPHKLSLFRTLFSNMHSSSSSSNSVASPSSSSPPSPPISDNDFDYAATNYTTSPPHHSSAANGPLSSQLHNRHHRRPRTPHTIAEPPWSPPDVDARIDGTLGGAAKASWWRLYADTVRLRQAGNNSSRAVYLAVNCWAAAAGISDRDERVALFRCYHDDRAVERLGYGRYGETMWELCEEEEEEREEKERIGRERGIGGALAVARTW